MSGARGFSLVELLIAMTLGLLLTSGMVAVFAGNRQSTELNSAVAEMQESARYALETLADDVRNAGYQGCLGVQSGGTAIRASSPPTTDYLASAATGSLVGEFDVWAPPPPLGLNPADHDAVPGTHTLSLMFGDADERRLVGQMKSGAAPSPAGEIELTEAFDDVEEGALAIISNCERADLFRITGLKSGGRKLEHNASGNDGSGNLGTAYGDARTLGQTAVMLFRANVYYVADTGRRNADGDSILALFRQSYPYDDQDDNPPTELVSGVESMRVAFGIRRPGGKLRYVPPESGEYVPELVESVRIGLLMRSRDAIAARDDDAVYVLAGQALPPAGTASPPVGAVHAGDRRHRLAFNTTVKIRNRRPE